LLAAELSGSPTTCPATTPTVKIAAPKRLLTIKGLRISFSDFD
jgi:hypothetical protein